MEEASRPLILNIEKKLQKYYKHGGEKEKLDTKKILNKLLKSKVYGEVSLHVNMYMI